jgi:hypothetical protein
MGMPYVVFTIEEMSLMNTHNQIYAPGYFKKIKLSDKSLEFVTWLYLPIF